MFEAFNSPVHMFILNRSGFTIDIWYLNCFLDSNDAIRINRTRIDMGFSKMCRSLF